LAGNTPPANYFFDPMEATAEQIEGGLWGLLVGDALGVPYEFHPPELLPPVDAIEMIPPEGFPRSYSHVPPGTWSDDGAQALCLAASLLECGGWDVDDFACRLLRWRDQGYLAVEGKVFDIGIQTGAALNNLAAGIPPARSGLSGERNNGNGSLMRSLPLALFGPDDPADLVAMVHEQSAVTHAHPRSEACCALYVLWARAEMAQTPAPFSVAIGQLRSIYVSFPGHAHELEKCILAVADDQPRGTGYVVDSLFSAVAASAESDFASVVKKAVSFGPKRKRAAVALLPLPPGPGAFPTTWPESGASLPSETKGC